MRIFFFGNCQLQSLFEAYRALVVPVTGDVVAWQHSFSPLAGTTPENIARADVLVTQIANFEPKTRIDHLPTNARRMVVPVVGAAFLWPYSGTPHPDALARHGSYNPYPSERSDGWLLKRLAEGVEPDAAVDEYLAIDIAKVAHLDRRYEMEMDSQRAREAGTPYAAADFIDSQFRAQKLFRTPYHPTLPMARFMFLAFLRALGVPDEAYARAEARMIDDYYLKFEMPVHPGIARHFGLQWADEKTRYAFYTESYLTFEAFMRRFVRCEAYPEVMQALTSVHKNTPDCRAKLEHALKLVPDSPWVHMAMGTLALRDGNPAEALPWLLRAREAYPRMVNLHAQLSECLHALGRKEEAMRFLRQELEVQPFNIRMYMYLSQAQKELKDFAGAAETMAQASAIEPHRLDLKRWHKQLLAKASEQEQPHAKPRAKPRAKAKAQ